MHNVFAPCPRTALWQGKHSSEEEDLGDVPDDDQYDTEDSFIDDAELVSFFIASEYFLTWMLAIYLDDAELVIKHKDYIEP